MTQLSPRQALSLLREGNLRFSSGHPGRPHQDAARLQLAGAQDQGAHAFATVLACSDSRVPVELIFDAGVMDLFVVRVAGNVVTETQAGSIEYGLIHVGTPVLVVLGHSQCGAVTAAVRQSAQTGGGQGYCIDSLLKPILPAVQRARAKYPAMTPENLVARAVEENVWQALQDLFLLSPEVRRLVTNGERVVRGAIYDVGRGAIAWLPAIKVEQMVDQVSQDHELVGAA